MDEYKKQHEKVLDLTRGEIALSQLFCQFNNHIWIFMKIEILEKILGNPLEFFEHINDKDTIQLLCENVKMEIVCATIHYIEIFVAYMRAFADGDPRFQKAVLEYTIQDIRGFLKKAINAELIYMLKITGYPPVEAIEDHEDEKKILLYCQHIKDELGEICTFYEKHKVTYNNFKHGLRIFPMFHISESGEKSPMMLSMTGKKMLAGMKFLDFDVALMNESRKISEFIASCLSNSLQVFKRWAIDKEEELEVNIPIPIKLLGS